MPADFLARFQPWRRLFEAGFWVVVLGVQIAFNSITSWIDLERAGRPLAFWIPFGWELSSVVVIGALILAVVAFERRVPIGWTGWRRALGLHLAATWVFCLLHVAGMVALRQGLHAVAGGEYRPQDWATLLAYEYLKDVRTYVLILVALWSYRMLLLRMQGEARVLDPPEPPAVAAASQTAGSVSEAAPAAGPAGPPPQPAGRAADPLRAASDEAPARPERFLVRKLRREFLIAAAEIEWLQAQGNYVGLHVNGHDYLLRSTLADFLQQLDPARFVRVHRSYAVNLDRIAEIEPLDAGDARLQMKDGSTVPCSRRYREALGR